METKRRATASARSDGCGDLCAGGKLKMPGFVLVQYHRRVMEADCHHLDQLRERLDADSRAVA
jgi:hypothetical protein